MVKIEPTWGDIHRDERIYRDYRVVEKLLDHNPDPKLDGFVDRIKKLYATNQATLGSVSTDFEKNVEYLVNMYSEDGQVDFEGIKEEVYWTGRLLDMER